MGKDQIEERITAFKNNEHMPDDILSSILASYSTLIANKILKNKFIS